MMRRCTEEMTTALAEAAKQKAINEVSIHGGRDARRGDSCCYAGGETRRNAREARRVGCGSSTSHLIFSSCGGCAWGNSTQAQQARVFATCGSCYFSPSMAKPVPCGKAADGGETKPTGRTALAAPCASQTMLSDYSSTKMHVKQSLPCQNTSCTHVLL